jgi:hypothetical protein
MRAGAPDEAAPICTKSQCKAEKERKVAIHRPNGGDDRLSTSETDAALRRGGPVSDDVPTVVMQGPGEEREGRGRARDQTQQLDTAAVHQPLIDRAGDALARQPGQLWMRYRRLEEHQRGVLAVVAALGAFLVLVALLGR